MTPLCFFVALMTVAIASPGNNAGQVNKRFLGGFLGGTSEGDFYDIPDLLLEEENAIHQFIVSSIKTLDEASSEDDYQAVFRRLPLDELCPYCQDYKKDEYIIECANYCIENGFGTEFSDGD